MTEHKEKHIVFRLIQAHASTIMCSAQDKMVLACLVEALNAKNNGTLVWPSQELLAEQTGLAERTVRRSMKNLCDNDLIKRQRTTGRNNVYSVNVGLIHRLLAGGLTGRSKKPERPDRPVRPAGEAHQTGLSDLLTTKEQPNEHPIPPFGCSSDLKVLGSDPVQRKFALHQVIAGATEGMRIPDQEQPTKKKSEERRAVAAVALAVKERPG